MSSPARSWWELEDGSIVAVEPDDWKFRYCRVDIHIGPVYWYIEPRSTMIVSPINPSDLPKTMEMILFLLGDS